MSKTDGVCQKDSDNGTDLKNVGDLVPAYPVPEQSHKESSVPGTPLYDRASPTLRYGVGFVLMTGRTLQVAWPVAGQSSETLPAPTSNGSRPAHHVSSRHNNTRAAWSSRPRVRPPCRHRAVVARAFSAHPAMAGIEGGVAWVGSPGSAPPHTRAWPLALGS